MYLYNDGLILEYVSRYIYNLIEKGEGQHLDFKFEISDARKIARTLVAFSNSNGGKLLIGVKDNGKIAGVRSEEEYYMLEAAASLYCKPEIKFAVKNWVIEGRTVLEVQVPPGELKPYLAKVEADKWRAYVRAGDQNLLANSIQIRVWKNEKRKRGIFLKYTDKEKFLLNYLEENEEISLTLFCRLGGISYRKASDIMVRLIGLRVVEIVYQGRGIGYRKTVPRP